MNFVVSPSSVIFRFKSVTALQSLADSTYPNRQSKPNGVVVGDCDGEKVGLGVGLGVGLCVGVGVGGTVK